MFEKYKKELILGASTLVLCLSLFSFIKIYYFSEVDASTPIKSVMKFYEKGDNHIKYAEPTTKVLDLTKDYTITLNNPEEDEELSQVATDEEIGTIPYEKAPTFVDDGSIIYDGLTITDLTNKLNKSLGTSYMANTGYFFANYTKKTGLDPYLAVSIVLLETGCNWKCSSITVKCNNIGGLKGKGSCNGTAYSKYDSLEEGIEGYLNILYRNYYLHGLTTANTMASKYAASPTWAEKVNTYYASIKAK